MAIIKVLFIFINFYIFLLVAYNINDLKFKINFRILFVLLIASIIYYYLIKINFLKDFKLVFTSIFLTLILSLTLATNILNLIKTSLLTITILIFSETNIVIIFKKISPKILNKEFTFILNLLIYTHAIFITYLRKLLNKKLESNINNAYNIIINIFVISVTLLILLIYSLLYKYFNILLNTMSLLLICIFSLSYLIISLAFRYITHISKKNIDSLKESEEKYKQLKIYSDITESLVEDVTKFRHDYKNIIFVLSGYIENNDYNSLKKYFNETILPERQFDEIPKLKKIKNSGLKGLITAKISLMQKENIKIFLDVFNDITEFSIDTMDLCRIIGIFLDNAIEASKESNEKFISICFINDSLNTNITVSNSFKGEININTIYKKGYSTKGNSRGIGLFIVQNIINEKYENILLNTFIQDNTFVQDIYIAK